jgi:Tol biopolymer transport system component
MADITGTAVGDILEGDGASVVISTDSTGSQTDGQSFDPVFSPDGTKVAFYSHANDLVAGDTNNALDIFVKDLVSGLTMRVSTDAAGGQADDGSAGPTFSPDGQEIAFTSVATNLVPGVSGEQLYLKNIATGAIQCVSSGAGNGGRFAAFSPNGSQIAFLANGGTFLYDRSDSATTLVSSSGDSAPVFSPDGSKLAYVQGTSLIEYDIASRHETVLAKIAGISPDSFALSPDWTRLAFISSVADLVPGDTNNAPDVFIETLATGSIERVSVSAAGVQSNGLSCETPLFSPDGTKLSFFSNATNLLGPSSAKPKYDQLFVKDLSTGAVTCVSTNAGGRPAAGFVDPPTSVVHPEIWSPDGSNIVYSSSASHLFFGQAGGTGIILLRALPGSTFNDVIHGGAGDDTVIGGAGADVLYGGDGADRFVFLHKSDSSLAPKGRDTIMDFSHAEGDRIDLSAIDANTTLTGHQAFTFTAGGFTHSPGELIELVRPSGYLVEGDVNGDAKADLAIFVQAGAPLVSSDFIL